MKVSFPSFPQVCSSTLGAAAALLVFASVASADINFTVKRMTRDDVPSGQGQCDLRFRVDNEVEVTLQADRVNIRPLAGQESRDEGSECNFPLPVGVVNNFRFEKMDGRGRVELMEDPSQRRASRAIFNVRDSGGGADRYHVRVKWDIQGSSNISSGRQGNRERDGSVNRGRNGGATNSGDGWGGTSSNNGWGTNSGNSTGWGSGSGWGNVTPPSSLLANGRGTVTWDRRANLNINRANVQVTRDRAVIRIETAENRTVEFRGRLTSSSSGFFEVDLDGSTEGAIDGVARVDYRNNNTLERIDLYGNAGNDRFRFDFRR
ncbi:MAG: hypothetical protein U5J83_18145 [Bryobacterales bacterium]|nr:hypothetical protein [Bryobacterales bacterium]